MDKMIFKITFKDKRSRARTGVLSTAHGTVDTPSFVPVGTQATVKSLTPQDLQDIGVQILFGNTYHLHLRPGEEVVKKFGGLGKFMGFGGVTMTDSGGFQVFSLARSDKSRGPVAGFLPASARSGASRNDLRAVGNPSTRTTPALDESPTLVKITDDGVTFRSHLDGSLHTFTPEESIKIQKKLGADIILAFDNCPPYPVTYEGAKKAMEQTHQWAKRCLKEFQKPQITKLLKGKTQSLFGIVQGSVFEDLRKESATYISSMDFDGIAIGGVAVGESKEQMKKTVDWTVPLLPEEKPRHLLGVGDVDDIFEIIERGIDTFDCVTPTRMGRVGFVFVNPPEGNLKNRFRIDITKSLHALSSKPLAQSCPCYVCKNFTRGYISHLFRARELLAYRLATYHNVFFITDLLRQIREAIINGHFAKLKKQWLG